MESIHALRSPLPLAPFPFPSVLYILLVKQSGEGVGYCDWCVPAPPLHPICSFLWSYLYCHCCYCRCCMGSTSSSVHRLFSQTLPPGVLLLCDVVAAEVLLLLPPFVRLGSPRLYHPVLRYFYFLPPNSRLFRHSYNLVSSSQKFACRLISIRSPRGRVGECGN